MPAAELVAELVGFGIFGFLALLLVLLGSSIMMAHKAELSNRFVGLFMVIISVGISYLFWRRYKVRREGLVVDFNKGTLSYPGGGIALNEVSNLFDPKYIFQSFYRFTIPLDEIRMLRVRDVKRTKVSGGGKGRSKQRFSYVDSFLEFNGAFGAVSLKIERQKRDEAYSIIRQYVGMGVPVVKG